MPGRRRAISRGFTLIELLIVVLILAIAAGVAVPMISNRSDLRLSAAARKVAADLQYAQALAISSQINQYVRFTANQYEVMTRQSGATTLVSANHPIDKMPFVVTFGSGATAGELQSVSLDTVSVGGGTVLMFDALGSPNSYNATTGVVTPLAGRVTLTLRCDGRTVDVYVEAYTGEISVSN